MKNREQIPSRYAALLKGQPKSEEGDSTTKVNFDTVTIYEFPVEIGDNPACREGCPIRLGHDLLWKSKMGINSYEEERGIRVQAKELYVDVSDRAAL